MSEPKSVNERVDRTMAEGHRAIRAAIDLQPVIVVLYALVLAVAVGGVLIWITGGNPFEAYWALLRGMFGSWDRVAASISRSTPYVGSALAMAFAFKAGLFNIGAEGQMLVGGVTAAWVGTWAWVADVPSVLAIPLVLFAGVVGGGMWGGIPGVLRARTGAHEVISCIMLNNIAILGVRWLVNSQDPIVLRDPTQSVPRTADIAESAQLPTFVDSTPPLSAATLIAIAMCIVFWFLLSRTSFGFEVGTVGANPHAAHYAGIGVNRIISLAMVIAGSFAGLAAAAEVSGNQHHFQPGVFVGYGFDGIAIALLARTNPFGILPAALLWGAMLSGAGLMQQEADVGIDVVRIVQSLVLLFVAADAIVRYVFRLKSHEPGSSLRAAEPGVVA